MDVVLEVCDKFLLDRLYASLLPAPSISFGQEAAKDAASSTFSSAHETPTPYQSASQFLQMEPSSYAYKSVLPQHNLYRQAFSLYLITWLFGFVVYFLFASLSYFFVFDHATFTHPKFLKNQVRLEIRQAMISMPVMAILTVPFFVAEVRGHAKLYDAPADAPFPAYNYLQFPFFIAFTDLSVYWIHRGLHHPMLYKVLHKPHHRWIMPTPYASHAFHPLDGWAQGVPYYVFPFLFPLQKFASIALFVFINFWTIMIHDGEYVADSPIINGSACHTMHHLYFNYNYGQFTTLWDRIGGSYRKPNPELFQRENKMSKAEWERQCQEVEQMQKSVEGEDDRKYEAEALKLEKKTS